MTSSAPTPPAPSLSSPPEQPSDHPSHRKLTAPVANKTEAGYRLALRWEADLINQLRTLAIAPSGEREVRKHALVNILQRSDNVSIELVLRGSPATNDEFTSLVKALSVARPTITRGNRKWLSPKTTSLPEFMGLEMRAGR